LENEKQLQKLLNDLGINHELNPSIKPTISKSIREIIDNLATLNINYVLFDDTDSLVLISSDYNPDIDKACNCLIMPSNIGVDVLIPLSHNQQEDGTLSILKKMFDHIIPLHIDYTITGVM